MPKRKIFNCNKCSVAVPPRTPTCAACRFFSNVQITNLCWLWNGRKNDKGYGVFSVAQNIILAHRFSCVLDGRDPGPLVVMHSCDNRACVNPNHLSIGTQQENLSDMHAKDRAGHKLNKEKAAQILQRHSAGDSQADLAREYGVTKSMISLVVKRKLWKSVGAQ